MTRDVAAQLSMRWIHPGRYLRGSSEDDPDAFAQEKPQHEVVLTEGFWMSDAPVTQAVWVAVMGDNPSAFEGVMHPVENIRWGDGQRFCARLSLLCPGLHPRLPTDAEWEYAARAGTTTSRYGALDDIAWYRDNSGEQTHPVRQKRPNAWGLYDMLGNVWQWCQDTWDVDEPYSPGPQVDPFRTDGSLRVIRGCSAGGVVPRVRSAFRLGLHPRDHGGSLGLRLVAGRAPWSRARPHSAGSPSGGPDDGDTSGADPEPR